MRIQIIGYLVVIRIKYMLIIISFGTMFLRHYVLQQHNNNNNDHHHHFQEMDLIADEIRYYEIIAGGGSGDARKKTRTVYIKQGDFDYIRYYDMCEMIQEQEEEGRQQYQHKNKNLLKEQWNDDWSVYIIELQLLEIDLLFKYAYGELQNIEYNI